MHCAARYKTCSDAAVRQLGAIRGRVELPVRFWPRSKPGVLIWLVRLRASSTRPTAFPSASLAAPIEMRKGRALSWPCHTIHEVSAKYTTAPSSTDAPTITAISERSASSLSADLSTSSFYGPSALARSSCSPGRDLNTRSLRVVMMLATLRGGGLSVRQ